MIEEVFNEKAGNSHRDQPSEDKGDEWAPAAAPGPRLAPDWLPLSNICIVGGVLLTSHRCSLSEMNSDPC